MLNTVRHIYELNIKPETISQNMPEFPYTEDLGTVMTCHGCAR